MPILQFKVQSNYDEVVRLRNEIESLESTLRNFGPGTAESTIRNLETQLERTRAKFTALTEEAARAGESIERSLRESMEKARSRGDVTFKVKADTKDLRLGMLETDREFQDLMKNLDTYSARLKNTFTSISSLAGFTLPLMGVLGFLDHVKQTRTYFQDIESTMTVLLGSEEKSLDFCKQLEAAAYWNMFEYSDLVGASKQMIAYGVATDQIIPKINQLSEVATATKGSLDEMVFMYNRAKAIGYVDSRAIQTWATHGLVVKDVLKEMGEQSVGTKVSFDQLNKVLDHVTGEGGMFHNVMKNQMHNISAEIGQLEDNTSLMFNEIGEELQEPLIKVIYYAGKIVEHWKEVGIAIGVAAAAAAGFKLGDKANTDLFNRGLDEANAKMQALKSSAADVKLAPDIEKALKEGRIDARTATEYQNTRDELERTGAANKTLDQLKEEAAMRIAVSQAMEEERQKLAELNNEYGDNRKPREMRLDDDLSAQVDGGNATRQEAEELQKARDEAEKLAQARLESAEVAGRESDEYAELSKMYEKDLEAAKERKKKADEIVESLREQVDLQDAGRGNNDELVDELDLESALREQAAAQAAVETAEDNINTAAKLANAQAEAQRNLTGEAQLITQQAQTAATATNTAATNANTGSVASNTVATKLAAFWDKTAATAKLMLSNAIKSVTGSIRAMGAAIIANPIGMLVTGISAAIGLFMAFHDNTEEASKDVERFGEAAVKTRNKVDTLYAVLDTVKKGSMAYRDALSQLEKIAKEYGITLDGEGDKYQKLIELRGRLIELIKEEGRQKQIANNIQSLQDQKEEAGDTFRKEMAKNISGGTDDERVKASSNFIINTWLDKIEDKRKDLVKLMDELDKKERDLAMERAKGQYQDHAKSVRLSEEITRERNQLMEMMNADAKEFMERQGKKVGTDWELDLNDAYQSLRKYVIETQAVNDAMDDMVNNQKDNAAKLSSIRIDPNLDYAKMEVKELTEKYQEAKMVADELSKTKVKPSSDPVDIHKLIVEAENAKGKMDEVDDAVATPRIDTRYLDIALDKLDNIKIKLRGVGGQVLNTTAEERAVLEDLNKRYGNIVPGVTRMAKSDMAKLNKVYRSARRRSSYTFGGTTYALNAEQSAVLQQFMDTYQTTQLDPSKMTDADKRLYQQLKDDLMTEEYKKQKDNSASVMKDIKNDYTRRLKETNTTEGFATLRSQVKEQMNKLDQDSELYKYYEKLIENIDKKDKSKKKKSNNEDPKLRAYQAAKAEEEEMERRAQLIKKAEMEKEELETAMMRDGSEKKIREIRNNAAKERHALEEELKKEAKMRRERDRDAWVKQNPKKNKPYAWNQTKSDEQYLDEVKEDMGAGVRSYEIARKERMDIAEVMTKDRDALRDFLMEYGDYEAKKKATEEHYDNLIAKAETLGEKLKLQSQKEDAVQALDKEEMDKDWGAVFSEIDNMSLEALGRVRQRLKDALEARDIDPKIAQVFGEQLDKVNRLMEQRKAGWASMLTGNAGALYQQLSERQRLRDNVDNAREKLQRAQGREFEANRDVATSKIDIQQMFKGKGVDIGLDEISQGNFADLTKKFQEAGGEAKDLGENFSKLSSAEDAASAASEATSGAAEELSSSMEALEGADGAGGLAMTDTIIHGVNDTIQSTLGLLSELGAEDTKFGRGMKAFAESSEYATQAWESLKSGNIMGVATGVLGSLRSLGDALGEWGIGFMGTSDKTLVEDVERLTAVNEELIRAVQTLTDELRDSSIREAKEKYKEALDNLKESQSNTQNLMAREGAVYNQGFLGIGGKHSSNRAIDKAMTASDWAAVTKAAGTSVRSAADFWNLTSEQMAKVARDAPAMYAKIKQYASQGYSDASTYMDTYIQYYEQIEELQDAYNESLTNISLDSVKSEFKSLLYDMTTEAEDFADSFEKMMQQAVINAMVNDIFADSLEKWYERFVESMESDEKMTAAEQEALQREWDDMVNTAIERRKEISDAMGWDSSSAQQSSRRSVASMSQDTGDAIEGRLTAIQISTEAIRASEQAGMISLAQITEAQLEKLQNDNRMFQHYENVEQQIAKCCLELMTISENTGAIIQPINDMRVYLNEMNKKL